MLRKTMLILALASGALALVLLAVVGGKLSSNARAWSDAPAAVAGSAAAAAAPIVGELAGTTADGTPVYRLPPITVATTRSAELARIEREDREASAGAIRVPVAEARAPTGEVRAEVPGPVVR